MEEKIKNIVDRLSLSVFGITFTVLVERDKIFNGNRHGFVQTERHDSTIDGRWYIQIEYPAPCTKTGLVEMWKGRKWYLSEYMTPDEIVKTTYCAFEACVKHEVMEGFKVDGKILFNPHVNFEELLKVSELEVRRD